MIRSTSRPALRPARISRSFLLQMRNGPSNPVRRDRVSVYMQTRAQLDIAEVVDNSRLSGFQWRIILLCGASLIMAGSDAQSMGYVAPAIIQGWKIPNSALGPVFSSALVGVLIGSLGFSMLSDRIGRRPVLIGATLYFAVMTL